MAIIKPFRIKSFKNKNPIIEFENISLSYGERLILDNISFKINQAEIYGMLGPNGVGKSTIFNLITGLISPKNGKIKIYGELVNEYPVYLRTKKFKIGFVPQYGGYFSDLTLLDNLKAIGEIVIENKNLINEKINYLISKFELENIKDIKAKFLSGGQKKKLVIAMSLINNPNLLLLDEPLSNLDSNLRLEMRAELKRLHQTLGCTIIFVTHDQMEAMTLATSIAVMNKGVIEQLAKPMEIYKNPKSLFVAKFVGSPQMNTVDFNDGEQLALSLLSKTKFEKNNVKTLGIRPESIKLTSKDNGDINGKIETIQPTGADWIVGLNISGKSIFAISSDQPPGNENDTIGLSFKLDGLHAFDRNDLKLEQD